MDGSACGEWVSRGGPSVATVIWMVVQVGSGGVKGTICCVILMVVHVGSGGVEGDHLLCHIDGSACGEWGNGGGPSVVSY